MNCSLRPVQLGTYKPQIHTHYLPHLSLSFARHTISLNTTFLLLSSDYTKSVHLQADRSLEFHTPQGCHYTTRLPRYGRDLKYDKRSTEALIPSVGVNQDGQGEVFRLNLEVGRYMRSYEVDVGGDEVVATDNGTLQGGVGVGSVNTAAVAEDSHNLLAFGTSLGTVEFWDPRSRGRVGVLATPLSFMEHNERPEVTALEFHRSGLTLAAGSSTGFIHLYDLRSPIPLLKKDQGYGYPIHTLTFLTPSITSKAQSSEPRILSADKRIIKIWDTRDGTPWTSVEPAVDVNSVAWCKDSGMFLTANEGRQQHAFFIPQLGPAPKWCSFLDNLVEEMAEDPNDPNAFAHKAGEVYDNYKFLTMQQLKSLNLAHLVGTTNLLRPYMHGFFVAQKLYEEAQLIADPFVWEEARAKRVKERIDKERESRIRGTRKVAVKVNKRLAEKMLEREDMRARSKAKRMLMKGGDDDSVAPPTAAEEQEATKKGLLGDSRFAKLFQDEDFAVDEESREFQSLNPSTKPERGLTAVEEEAIGESASSSDTESSAEEVVRLKENGKISTSAYTRAGHRPQMKISSSRNPQKTVDRPFGSRAVRAKSAKRDSGIVGEKQVTFAPERKARPDKVENPATIRLKGRRSASGNVFRGL